MTYTVVIPGRYASLNEYIEANRKGKYIGNKMKQRDQHTIAWQILQQIGGAALEPPLHLSYRFFEENRKRDKDNVAGYFSKVFQDALVESGLISNDNWEYIKGFSHDFDVDAEAPRIEVEINGNG